jgi:uncharacterized membrane protein
MSTKMTSFLLALLVVLLLIASGVAYSHLPERVPSHWDAQGQVNGYSGPFMAAFFTPLLAIVLVPLLMLLPLIDPLKANIQKFRGAYNLVVLALLVYLIYVHALTLYNVLVQPVNITLGLLPAFIGLDLVLAYTLAHTRQNWFMGIRTPWTMSNAVVWDKTHRLGSRLLYAGAALSVVGFFIPQAAFVFMIVPLLLMAVVTIPYSYVVYRQETQAK